MYLEYSREKSCTTPTSHMLLVVSILKVKALRNVSEYVPYIFGYFNYFFTVYSIGISSERKVCSIKPMMMAYCPITLHIMTMMISDGPFVYYDNDDILWSMIMTYGPFECTVVL